MEIRCLEIPGPIVVLPEKFQDERGFLSQTYVDEWFSAKIAPTKFVQDNHTFSVHPATIRGIHFQIPPHAQGKLVRVVRGSVWDVAVDLRTGSPNFGRFVGVELSAKNWQQLWIPVGFGHAFCTLEPDTEVLYKITERYVPSSERGVRWNDADLAIDWPIGSRSPIIADRDQRLALLKDSPSYFQYEPTAT